MAAVENYQHQLRHQSPSELDDLWNQPRGASPTPKIEERVSDKVCVAVRNYFRDFALTASREVQVFRRKLASSRGGAPGSEVDVLCEVPTAGTVADAAIKIPIEVKLAHNPEARTGMRSQLVDRYMSELGTDLGVYVVVWMGKGEAAAGFRPLWNSPDDARIELERQANEVMEASAEPKDIRCIVIDASLPLAAKRRKPARRRNRDTSQTSTRLSASQAPPAKQRSKPKRKARSTSAKPRSTGRRPRNK